MIKNGIARGFALGLFALAAFPVAAQLPELPYKPAPGFFQLPPGANFGEVPGVAVNSKGHIFVFHRGAQPLMEFDPSGKFIRSLGDDLFTRPHGLRVDRDDNLWITDIGSHLVLKLSPAGRVLMVFGRKGRASESDQEFNQPSDVAFGPAGELYVTDGYGNSRVVKFDRSGRFVKAWGTKGSAPGQFNLPHNVVVDKQGLVYVADRENKRIQIFDADGKFLREWTHVGSPWGLAFGPDQTLFVASGREERVLKLDLNGKILGVFGEPGKGPGQFGYAHGIAVGPGEEIYVAEVLNWRVQKLVKK